jgi:hypothetical protein
MVGGTTLALEARDLRAPGAAMLVLGAVLPLLPGDPGLTCPLRALTGVPCPLCGMTTSVEATVRLDLAAAFAANPAGLALVPAALLALAGRPRRLDVPALAAVAGLAAMWLFELARFSIL